MNLQKYWSKLFKVVLCLIIPFTLLQFEAFGITKKNKTMTKNKQTGLWKAVEEENITSAGRRLIVPEKYQIYRVNQPLLGEVLGKAPLEFTNAAKENQVILEIPTPEGTIARFRIEESPMLSPEIAKQFPTWKTFQGQGIDDPTATARFDTNANGFHGYVTGTSGTFLINPYAEKDRDNYIVYYKGDLGGSREPFACKFNGGKFVEKDLSDEFLTAPSEYSNGAQLRNFRVAVSATKQYTNFFGGNQTTAFAAIQTTINRLITIYRRELATTFTLVSGTNTVFTNADDGGFTNNSSADTDRNQIVLDQKIGSANYDLGHVLSVTPNPDGLAASPSLCDNTAKAQGFTGSAAPQGDGFDVDYVAHEFGHQFGMSHTFNNDADGSCTTREATSAFEPGSGVTIMGYGGICAPRNLAANSIEFFHARSFVQSLGHLATVTTCGTTTATGNTPPSNVSAGANFNIPKQTPFTLNASATDTDAGLTYSWEEYDLGAATRSTGAVDTDEGSTARPIFRSYNPTTQSSRTFPSLTYILNNANTPPLTYTGTLPNAPTSGSTSGYVCAPGENCVVGERLPSIARTMAFRVTVRDNNPNGGGVADASTQITVDGTSGPFLVASPNSAVTWQSGAKQTITWNVANTTNATVNAQNVNILLSTDGGNTFPIVLAANTPNDGTESITVPNNATTQGRIKIQAVGNIFFDINDANLTILGTTAATVSVSGRAITADGRGITNVRLTLIDSHGQTRTAISSSFGYYHFENVRVGETYTITATGKRFTFSQPSQVLNVNDETNEVNFIGLNYVRR